MSRPIRNQRAQQLQGRRAGIASRALADAIDVAIGFALYLGIFAAVSTIWDLFFSEKIAIPKPPGWFSIGGGWLVLVLYLAAGWAATGRSIGKQVMGLRVVRADAEPLRGRQALGRAVLCASFYPGLLLALLDRRNRALEDVVFNTVVVYDWIPESASPRRLARAPGASRQPVA